MHSLADYREVAGADNIEMLRDLARHLQGASVVNVNSTSKGGGVAEILQWLVPLMNELGLKTRWETIKGDTAFFETTKAFHNGLQGNRVDIPASGIRAYEEINAANAEALKDRLSDADFVFIHDPQPARLIRHFQSRKGIWIWRCHIDASRPYRPVWKYVSSIVKDFNASVFSMAAFAQPLPHPQFLISPSIDPLSEKNCPIENEEVTKVLAGYGIDCSRPLLTQISRFDRFKDPVGVIKAYRLVKKYFPVQLLLAGSGATDDPEGDIVLKDVLHEAADDPDIHVLLLPPDAHRTINALQRGSRIVIQKSTREGFGLTVAEALWKYKPVIGGDVGGISIQVINGHTGYLVHSPEGAAHSIRYLLQQPVLVQKMGIKGNAHIRENFLLTRHIREYLTLMLALKSGQRDRLVI